MSYRRMTPQQRATYHALRQLGGEITVTPDTARPLHALKRRGLVRFARDDSGAKVARLRLYGAAKRRKFRGDLYRTLVNGLFIPPIEGTT